MPAARPGGFQRLQRPGLAGLGAAVQPGLLAVQVVAQQHRIVPARPPGKRQVQQQQHRGARRHLQQRACQRRAHRMSQHAVAAQRGLHFPLQAALAAGQVDLAAKGVQWRGSAGRGQHHGQGRGPAQRVVLADKGRAGRDISPARQPRRGRLQQPAHRWRQRAAAQPRRAQGAKPEPGAQTAQQSAAHRHGSPVQRIDRVKGNTLVKPSTSVISSSTKMKTMVPTMSLAPAGALSICCCS